MHRFNNNSLPKLLRPTTVPISLKLLLTGQPTYLRERDWDVHLCSADGPERSEVIQTEGCPHHIISFTRAITPLQDLRCLWQLYRLLRQLRPDIVHTHTPKAGLIGMLAARLARVPVRIHTIAGLPFMTASGGKQRLLIAIEKLTYWGAQHVWPNSQSMLKVVQENRLCPAHKLDIISAGSTNGIDLTVFSPEAVTPARQQVTKESIHYDPACTYIMAIGRIVKDKGIPELVEAFVQLHQQYPQLRLVLVGPIEKIRTEETLPKSTTEQIASHPAIIITGWTDDVPAYLSLTNILVHASHREGFPNAPLQAGAMQVPIVCSAIPGNVDIVTHEKTGYTYPVGDIIALAATIERVLTQPAVAERMAQQLRIRIEQHFDRKVIHQTLLEKYKELLSTT